MIKWGLEILSGRVGNLPCLDCFRERGDQIHALRPTLELHPAIGCI